MTRYEAALEAAIVSATIRDSDEPGLVASAALLCLVSSEMLTSEEVLEVELFVSAIKKMNQREFAHEMAEEYLALIRKFEPGAALLQ